MADKSYSEIAYDGLWGNNVTFVQILGLCPTLAVTNSLINGLGMGLATALVLASSNTLISAVRHVIRPDVRIPVYVLVIASLVTIIDLLMNAYLPALHKSLGIFIPLIVVNCTVIGRAEAFASKNSVGRSFADGLTMGIGFTLALVLLGGMRELIGSGTLFAHSEMLFGAGAKDFTITVFHHYQGLLLAILPPGAFLGLGLLIALKHFIDAKVASRRVSVEEPAGSEATAAG